MERIINITSKPGRDMYDLTRRLKAKPGEAIPQVVNDTQPDFPLGHQDTFYIADQQNRNYFSIGATVVWKTEHAYFYVQNGENYNLEQLKSSADAFENNIYPTIHKDFGSEWTPGVDNDPRITVLHARIAELGYFSSADEYPRQINPYSNQREMIYLNVLQLQPGTDSYNGTLAHEFQHMVHWDVKRSEEAWINEGSSELAMRLTGYEVGGLDRSFLISPNTQLDEWAEEPGESLAHYGAAYLFLSYLAERSGSYEAIKQVIAESDDGVKAIDDYLSTKGLTFDQVFTDWVVANYLDRSDLAGGRYGYKDIQVAGIRTEEQTQMIKSSGWVHQNAAKYVDLRPNATDFDLLFQGDQNVKVVPNDAHSGEMQWWSNRGDVMDTSMTRRVDLSGVQTATLKFWAWYNIEKSFDFAYVMVSTDDGQTWQTLPGQSTTTDNPLGTNLGSGYTGVSGGGEDPQWIQESIDLSQFAGKSILLRFEYVTDDVYHGDGFSVDDLSIPEIDFTDSADALGQWDTKGFIRLRNLVPEHYAVQVVTEGGQTNVVPITLDSEQKGRLPIRDLRNGTDKATLIIAAISPATTVLAPYTYELTPTNGQ
jgi:hypothetical protein